MQTFEPVAEFGEAVVALDDDAAAIRSGLRAAGIGLFEYVLGASHLRVSARCAELLDRPGSHELPRSYVASLLHPDELDMLRAAAMRTAEGNGRAVVVHRVQLPGGQVRWLRTSLLAQHDARGRVTRWSGASELAEGAPETWSATRIATLDGAGLADVATRLQLATAAAGIGIHDFDIASGSIRWDTRVREIWGVGPDEPVTYGTFMSGLHPGDLDRVDAAVRGSLDPQGDGTFSCEYRVVHRATRVVRWVHTTGRVTFTDGKAVRMVGTVQDISERKRLYDAVEAVQSRLQMALDASSTGLWSWDPLTDQMLWSPETHRILGVPEGVPTPTGTDFVAMIHPEDQAAAELEVELAVEQRRPYECEFRLIRPDGSLVWIAERGQAIRDESDGVLRVTGTVTNVTQRRRDEEAVRRGEERLRLALEAARAGAWDWDVRANEVLWSPEMFELFGIEHRTSPLTFAEFAATIDPRDLPAVEHAVAEALAGRTAQYRTEFRVIHPDGSCRWLTGLGKVQPGPDGRPLRMYGLNLDITAYKQLEEALQRADRQKDEFLAMLSHELRNPLAPIRTVARILESPLLDEAQIAWARQVIQRQVHHLALLLDDLLDVARITQGKLEIQRTPVTLQAVLEPAIEAVQPLLVERHHRLVLDLPPGPVEFRADPLRLSQVVSNLLANAAKYTNPGGRVELRARAEADGLVIEVVDNGVGIPADALPHIFGLFAQVDATRALSGGGLGVGLALVRGLLELHGGRVEAESDGPGCGSTFRAILPWSPDESVGEPPGPPSDAAPTAPLRVLVVDDNSDAADALGVLLQLAGHEVWVEHGGAEALRRAQAVTFDAAVIDIGMPDMDGYELARRLRELPAGRTMLLVALTGWGQASDKTRAAEAGFDEHLTKPVDTPELQAVLRLRQGGAPGPAPR
ncbi:MAG TPA: PAS domain-containing protein [Steroidobacteraceae bacterium]|nr:PAS domain-containing protein [Steroidobacteraceae bacterium]